MSPIIAVIAPGAMGAAVGKRLADHGARVLTALAGRSAASQARAAAAGMIAADDAAIIGADFLLSILPPGEALALAERLAPMLAAADAKPIYVDCNAVSPATVERIAAAVNGAGCGFVDAGIIGPPPPSDPARAAATTGTRFYASGPAASHFAELAAYGLDIRVLNGPTGAASALKMSYAGITKGTQALGAAMLLAASRVGSAPALIAELELSQCEMLAMFRHQLAIMPPKAHRWVAEMREIADFVSTDPAARDIYEGAARFYEEIAADFAADRRNVSALFDLIGKKSC
jgi:3-hydroxyisobutyrate dehydrogenase-like beta-hydroxyacid dehydrogenase